MRCSSCKPLLDRYLAGALRPRQRFAVREHLAQCAQCAALHEQTKIVDALLITSPTLELAPDFTGAAMAEVRAMPAPRSAHPAPWAFLIVYLTAAWFAGFVWLTVTGQSVQPVAAAMLRRAASVMSLLGSLAGSGHALGRNTATVLAFGLGVLLLDFALLMALLVTYRVIRPHLVAQVASTPEVS